VGGIIESLAAVTVADVATGVATGAAVGGGLGGIEAAATGGNILTGIEGGALGGAVTGGLGAGFGVGAEAGAFGAGTAGDIGGGALAGALGGVVSSGITGGNMLEGAGLGGVIGGVGGYGSSNAGVSAADTANATPTTGTGGGTSAISAGGANVSAPGAIPDDLTAGTAAGSSGQPAVSVTDMDSAKGVGWGSNTSPITSSPLSNVGVFAGNANPSQVLGSITSPEAGGTGSFVNNPIYGTGASSTGSFPTGGGTGVGQGSLADASNWLTNNQTPGSGLGSSGAGATGSTPNGAAAGGNVSSGKQILNALGQGDLGGVASGLGNAVVNNPGAVVGALGLGAEALMGQQQPKGYNQVSGEANQLASQGAALQQSLNGALPAGAQSALNQASNSAKARIRSTYAASGLSGSTMEAQALAGVDQTVAAQGFQMADQLYQQGVQESGMAANLYQQIMNVNAQSDAALSSSIGNFSAALAGAGVKSQGNT